MICVLMLNSSCTFLGKHFLKIFVFEMTLAVQVFVLMGAAFHYCTLFFYVFPTMEDAPVRSAS